MFTGGSCGDSEYSFVEKSGIARKPHKCNECSADIKIGEPFSWAIWGLPGEGGGSARRCQFCASFAAGYECIQWGGLKTALENADLLDLLELPEPTRKEIVRKFGKFMVTFSDFSDNPDLFKFWKGEY